MLWTKQLFVGAGAIAIGLTLAGAADAAPWIFGGQPAVRGSGVVLAQAGDADRLNRLETQIRNLTGQIEVLTHQVGELQTQLQRTQEDNEYRFGELENAVGGGKPLAPASPPPAATPPPAAQQQGAAPAQPQAGPGAPPKSLGELILPGPEQPQGQGGPLDLSALARGDGSAGQQAQAAAPQQMATAPSGDPQTDYKNAYELFVAGQYGAAEAAFRQFLAAYPGDPNGPNATYWLGQSLFSRGMYREAALEFVNGHKLYPKSPRAADTMLLLGKSLAGIPEPEAACQTFAAALKQYPQMSNALRQRVITEQANAGC